MKGDGYTFSANIPMEGGWKAEVSVTRGGESGGHGDVQCRCAVIVTGVRSQSIINLKQKSDFHL